MRGGEILEPETMILAGAGRAFGDYRVQLAPFAGGETEAQRGGFS